MFNVVEKITCFIIRKYDKLQSRRRLKSFLNGVEFDPVCEIYDPVIYHPLIHRDHAVSVNMKSNESEIDAYIRVSSILYAHERLVQHVWKVDGWACSSFMDVKNKERMLMAYLLRVGDMDNGLHDKTIRLMNQQPGDYYFNGIMAEFLSELCDVPVSICHEIFPKSKLILSEYDTAMTQQVKDFKPKSARVA